MGRLAPTRAEAAAALAVLCALLAIGACTGGGSGDGDEDKPRAAAQPKKLKKAWEASLGQGSRSHSGYVVWTGEGVLALRDGEELRGYDARTGKKRWTLKTPKGTSGVCGTSAEPNAAGLGGVFFTAEKEKGKKGACTYAGTVNLADGEVGWARDVGRKPGGGEGDISVGDEAATVTLDCYGVKQFRTRDGKPLGTRLKSDKACAHDVDHNGRHLAVREAPVGNAKERVPGWMPAAEGAPAHFALYEDGKPEPVWRTKADRVADKLRGIVSDEPLVLDISRDGHRLLQTYDSDGRPVHTIGKQLSGFSGDGGTQDDGQRDTGPYVRGDTLVMGYERDSALYAYDLRTGEVRWKKRRDGARVLGVWRDKLLAVRQMKGGKGSKGLPVPWLVTLGTEDGKERTIGRIAESGVQPQIAAVWDDERVYLRRADREGRMSVVAYPLPRSGGDTRRYAAEPAPRAVGTPVAERGWRKGDLRPDKVGTACEAVSPTARKAMRVYRKGMPPPVGCAWEERYTPRHADRVLDVTVTAHQPGEDEKPGLSSPSPGGREPTPAVEVAEKAFRKAGREKDEDAFDDDVDRPLADAHRLRGLGDEAKSNAFGSMRAGISSAHVLVRHRNVTVRVKARTNTLTSYRWGEVPPRHRAEAAARVAAADVLERLGADVPAAAKRLARPAGGGITKAEPVCARLRSEAAGLAPGVKALDTTPKGGSDGRVTGCHWESETDLSPSLTVRVKALPDSPLTGDGATKQAKAEITSADGAGGAELSGIGDEARLERDTFRHKAEMTRTHTLTARKGNLVIYVEYQRWHHPSKPQLDAGVRRVARRVLSAY
ncbi:PQQ-binding-like beta-propeller repeat protein [Streptomyces sp. NPDC048172]|uniref:outer membrane protein assembly factor BamB family protein n=1 Tax=Streptomyces sp. NPDC048172 TaxID=3365505 RepID=UPI003717D35E